MEEAAELGNYLPISFLDAFHDLKQQDLNNNIVSFVSKSFVK